MRIVNNSIIIKIFALIRFLIIKVYYLKRLQTSIIIFFGKHVDFYINKNSKIIFKGKAHIYDNVEIRSNGKIIIGNNFSINKYSRIIAHENILIGDNCLIAQFVTILDHDHAYMYEENKLVFKKYIKAPIVIGDNVWIGDKVTILKGVNIGSNVIIGANSAVVENIPSNCIVAGTPAKLIKYF
jgi:acetyltransferase-like isoleucine patch superfamily enzyme